MAGPASMFQWLSDASLAPHGFCLLWEPGLVWSFVVGDGGTALSYFAIPVAIAKLVSRRRDMAFRPVFWLFAAFILLCGMTHGLDLFTLWVPAYSAQAALKVATAGVSFATAIAVWKLLPKALSLPSPRQMQEANERLTASEDALRQMNTLLEDKVAQRTVELEANEKRLSGLLTTLDLGTFMTRDMDGTIRFWSGGCARLYGWSAEEAIGRVSHELLCTIFPVPLSEVETALERDGVWTGDLQHRTREGREVIVAARKILRRDAKGDPEAVLEALTDVTESRKAERERNRIDALLRGIVAAAPGLIYAKDCQGRLLLGNHAVSALIGKPWKEVEGRTDLEFLDDKAQAEVVMLNDRRVMEDGITEETEELVGVDGGRPRVWLSTKTPLRGIDGRVEGLVGISVEITERKRAEDRLRLMVHELNHRVKNTLATVQAVASQTLRGSDPVAVAALVSRLQALASAHDALTRESWQGVDLRAIVTGALAPLGGEASERFVISGPAVELLPREAVALAMALHELATNAVKYGALRPDVATGHVELTWTADQGRLHLVWAECGGPPVSAPTRRGFGTRLIERSLSQDLEGDITLAFKPEGVTCTVNAPLGAASPDRMLLPALLEVGTL